MLRAPVVSEGPQGPFVAIFDRAAVFRTSTSCLFVMHPPSGQIAAWFIASVVLASISFAIHWASASENGITLHNIVVAVVVVFTGCVGVVRCDGFVVGGLVKESGSSERRLSSHFSARHKYQVLLRDNLHPASWLHDASTNECCAKNASSNILIRSCGSIAY